MKNPSKELQDEWAKKLKESGFEDIEQTDGRLKTWHSTFLSRAAARDVAAIQQQKQEYYRLAGHFLHDHAFKNAFDRRVWELHANGESVRDIVTQLAKEGNKTYRRKVHVVIQALVKEMVAKCL